MKKIKIRAVSYKKIPMKLLLLADPSEEAIKKYLEKSDCFAAYLENDIVGICVILKNKNEMEIMNIAVSQNMQNKGIGKLLILDAIKKAKEKKIKKLLVGTGNSSFGQLEFYKKCGFKVSGIRKDFFIKNYKEPIFENGVQCKDMIMLELVLA